MWGSTFADLAKKAREQAEELSTQLPTSSVNLNAVTDGLSSYGVGGLFNLDSIQSTVERGDITQQQHQQQQSSERSSSEMIDIETKKDESSSNNNKEDESSSNNNIEESPFIGNEEEFPSNNNVEVDTQLENEENVKDSNIRMEIDQLDETPMVIEEEESKSTGEEGEIVDDEKEILVENDSWDDPPVVVVLVEDETKANECESNELLIEEEINTVECESSEAFVEEEDGWEEDDIPMDDNDETPTESTTAILIGTKEVESATSSGSDEDGFKSVRKPVEDVSSGDIVWDASHVTPQTTTVSDGKTKGVEVDEEEEKETENSASNIENEPIDGKDSKDNESTHYETPVPLSIETQPPATNTRPTTQSPNQSSILPPNSNKKQNDAIPPHIVQKFMQQILRITEHHKTELSILQQKLEEKEALLDQKQQQPQQQILERQSSSDKFKELQKQEEYYKKLIQEQKKKLEEERSQNTVLKTSLTQQKETNELFTVSVKSDMENQRVEFKNYIQKLEMQLSTTQNSEKEAKDRLEILDKELPEKEDLFKKQSMEYQKMIQSKNVKLEEERTKVEMFQSNLDSLLERGKNHETSSHKDQIKIQLLEEELTKFQNELDNQIKQSQTLQENLKITLQEKTKSEGQYESLKSRVKVVATELKDRRQENRDLKSTHSNLTTELVMLKDEKEKLKTELQSSKCSSTDEEQKYEEYQQQFKEMKEELQVVQTNYNEVEAVGNAALQQYKKKAQAALANANARSASANQAREEMEVEVRSLKAAAEEAEAGRTEAIKERIEAIAKITSNFKELDDTYQSTVIRLQQITHQHEESTAEKEFVEQGLQDSVNEQHRLYDEIQKLSDEVTKQKELADSYSTEFDQEKSITRDLTHRLRNLKDQHERSAAALFLAKQKGNSGMSMEDSSSADHAAGGASDNTKHLLVQNEGMVNMLQEELDGANEAIKELKRELRNAFGREKERGMEFNSNAVVTTALSDDQGESCVSEEYHKDTKQNDETNNDSSAMPLFYAIEKQAELSIARDEINRLANLVSEIETLKRVALEEKDNMRKKMEEAEARLRRHEKLGLSEVATRSASNTTPRASPHGGMYKPTPPSLPTPETSENLNLEYLKNITLRYIKASTISERKSLIPVLAAVLCLTEDETQNAIAAVGDSAGLSNVGSAWFESTKSFLIR